MSMPTTLKRREFLTVLVASAAAVGLPVPVEQSHDTALSKAGDNDWIWASLVRNKARIKSDMANAVRAFSKQGLKADVLSWQWRPDMDAYQVTAVAYS